VYTPAAALTAAARRSRIRLHSMALLHTRTMSAASAHLFADDSGIASVASGSVGACEAHRCCTAALDEHALVTAEREANGGGGQ